MYEPHIPVAIGQTVPLLGLVWFYGISTIVGYLMPNPLYTYILDIGFSFGGFYGRSTIVI